MYKTCDWFVWSEIPAVGRSLFTLERIYHKHNDDQWLVTLMKELSALEKSLQMTKSKGGLFQEQKIKQKEIEIEQIKSKTKLNENNIIYEPPKFNAL